MSGAITISIAAETTQAIAIAVALQPAWSSLSGMRTPTIPKTSAGTLMSQSAWRISTFRSARLIAPGRGGSAAAPGVRSVHAASTTVRPASPTNTSRGPTWSARAPIAGPNSAPKIAEPIAVPSLSPRRVTGEAAMSQVSAPAQASEPPTPCAKREIPSVQASPANPKARLAMPMSATPMSMARRGP